MKKVAMGAALIKGSCTASAMLEQQEYFDFKISSEKYGGMSALMRKLIREFLKKNNLA